MALAPFPGWVWRGTMSTVGAGVDGRLGGRPPPSSGLIHSQNDPVCGKFLTRVNWKSRFTKTPCFTSEMKQGVRGD